MGIKDDAVEVRAQGWRTLAALHGLIEAELERALRREPQLSVVEYTVLDALSRQDGWHMRMQQLARAAALSASATTRLVNRLEDRGLLTRDPVRRRPPRHLHRAHRQRQSSCWRRPGRSTTPRWSGPWPKRRRCRSWHPWWTPSPGCTPACTGHGTGNAGGVGISGGAPGGGLAAASWALESVVLEAFEALVQMRSRA